MGEGKLGTSQEKENPWVCVHSGARLKEIPLSSDRISGSLHENVPLLLVSGGSQTGEPLGASPAWLMRFVECNVKVKKCQKSLV